MRGNSRAKKDESVLKNAVRKLIFSRLYAFRHGESEFEVYFKAEVVIMVLLRMRNNKVDTVNPNLKCILKPDKVCFRADAKVFFLD